MAGLPQVTSTSGFKIQTDRLLLPASANRQAVCLQPMPGNVVSSDDCTSGVTLDVSYDPVRREVTARQSSENGALLPGTFYELTVFAAVLDTDNGLRSFDGIPLAGRVQIDFVVAPDPSSGRPPFDPGPTGDHFCTPPYPASICSGPACPRSVQTMLGACAYSGCHKTTSDGAAEGMDLSSPGSILATAMNVVAHETQTGEAASTPEASSTRFARAMPILDPGVPGESYLVYKLLANHATPLVIPFPGQPDADGDPPEVERLRDGVVVGMPMPPDNASVATALRGAPSSLPFGVTPRGEAEWLSEWLLQGAPLACSP